MQMQKAQSASYARGVTALPPTPKLPGRGAQRPTTVAPSPTANADVDASPDVSFVDDFCHYYFFAL
jgi:hypothetical protein